MSLFGLDLDAAMSLAERGVSALERMADSLTWLHGELERTDLIGKVSENQHDRWSTN